MTTQVSLTVNGEPIRIDYFVQGFIHNTIAGILNGLRGAGEIKTLELSVKEDGEVVIDLNNSVLPANEFVQKITKSTVFGMVSTLKGVNEINTLKIEILR